MTSVKEAKTKDRLRKRIAELNAEIGAYPAPITGCDAQFNHLLEERARLNAELTRFEKPGGEKR